MTINVGDPIPSIELSTMTPEGPKTFSSDEFLKGKKIAMFGLPGAFTPTCSAKHLPGFVEHSDAIKAKGIDNIICISVNDCFVMGAWGKDQNVGDKVMMVADGSAKFAKATGLLKDLTERGMGIRCQRFSMIVDDGIVKSVHIDESALERTSAEEMLSELDELI
ncbi:MAG: peroxiredoxin [Magnetovibrio sp.]|nr:peroxiredoxin [Magnetovibrio sp.]|tara:strand:- start:2786 stop:3277 length:492 start_codon:yes stop_codon:yes gene_type:complete